MKSFRTGILVLASAVLYLAASCAVEVDKYSETALERVFNAFIRVNGYENSEMIGDSIYVVKREGTGVGESPADSTYAFVRYTAKYTNGAYAAYSYDSVAMEMGTYNKNNFYGPYVWPVKMGYISDPLSDVLKNMKPGEKTTSVIAPWLTTTNHSTAFASTEVPVIYDIELLKVVPDIKEYQRQVMQEFSNKYFGGMDTTRTGFYFKKTYDSGYQDTIVDAEGIDVYYIGRLLDGTVFDTNVEDTAKKYDLYNSLKTYDPLAIVYYKDEDKLVEEADLVRGFCRGLISGDMTFGDKCFIFFDSDLGYGDDGNLDNGSGIPPFYPISFEIWIEDEDI